MIFRHWEVTSIDVMIFTWVQLLELTSVAFGMSAKYGDFLSFSGFLSFLGIFFGEDVDEAV